ncbi:MAG: hypothetical protein MN733_00070 [Nitrososphaera sp.]|nr:hypothetical protein [Nitrososphaera sp.]
MRSLVTLQAILAADDPFLDWVKTEDDLCEAVLYRAAIMYQIGELPPQPKGVFDLIEDPGCALVKFDDDSLYCESSGDPAVWAQASYFLAENFHLLSETEKEFLS